ncbi:MAG: pyruvate kinase, partial [Desulfobia sp.]
MKIRPHKTKMVCTIGPASYSPDILEQMVLSGMDVARLNFSHGTPDNYRRYIAAIRSVSRKTGRRVAIMGDLPGPKIRIGRLAAEPVELSAGDQLTLTVGSLADGNSRIFVNFELLPQTVEPGDRLFLNDGLIQLEVRGVSGDDILCVVG